MPISSDPVSKYLTALRPERSPVMQEMEALAEKDGIPIVHWETGRLLASLARQSVRFAPKLMPTSSPRGDVSV